MTASAESSPINIEFVQSFFNRNGFAALFVLFHGECILGIFKSFTDAYTYQVRRSNNAELQKDETIQLLRMDYSECHTINNNWVQDRQKDIQNMKELLNLHDRISAINHRKIAGGRVGSVELILLYLMQHPELAARHPRFRKTCELKSKELINDIQKNPEYPRSYIILEEFPKFLEAIKTRSDFVAADALPPGWEMVLSYPGGLPVWKNTLTGKYVNVKPTEAAVNTHTQVVVGAVAQPTSQPPVNSVLEDYINRMHSKALAAHLHSQKPTHTYNLRSRNKT